MMFNNVLFVLISSLFIHLCYSNRRTNEYYEDYDQKLVEFKNILTENIKTKETNTISKRQILNPKFDNIIGNNKKSFVKNKFNCEKSIEQKINAENKTVRWLLFGNQINKPEQELVEYESYNGWYNNKLHSQLGSVDSQLIRLLSTKYSDEVSTPVSDRPNPILLSESLMNGEIGEMSETGKTAFFVYFGQQIMEEIVYAQSSSCPPEYMNIQIPEHIYNKNGTLISYSHSTGHKFMPLLRTRKDARSGISPNNPRQQVNEATPWIDGGVVYGTSKGWADSLRHNRNGLLLSMTNDKEFPAYNDINLPMDNPPPPSGNMDNNQKPKLLPVNRFFRLGNPRGNENPFLLTIGVIWFQWHNTIANQIHSEYPNWSDERKFYETRKWVIASYQQIVINEWLPILLGCKLREYTGYDPTVDPQISHVFQTAAFGLIHTLMTAGGIKRNRDCSSVAQLDAQHSHHKHIIRMCNSFWKPTEHLIQNKGFEELILGLTSQPAEKEDSVVVEDLRGSFYGPLEFTRRDLIAINIQRGRDYGLPDYLTARRELGLDKEDKSWESIEQIAERLWKGNINRNPKLSEIANNIYENMTDKIDVLVGGLLEDYYGNGNLFKHIIAEQFIRIRDGDRFWFENQLNNQFTSEEILRIKNLTIYDIIRSITDLKVDEIQPNLFRLPTTKGSGSNPISEACEIAMLKSHHYQCVIDEKNTTEKCISLGSVTRTRVILDNCTAGHTFDYFEGSEFSYAISFLSIGIFAIICFVVLKVLVDRKLRANKQKINSKVSIMSLEKVDHFLLVQEWVGSGKNPRSVLVEFDSSEKCIIIKLGSGNTLVRGIDLKYVSSIHLLTNNDKSQNYLIIKLPKEYDFVLKFNSYYDREKFVARIQTFFEEIGVRMTTMSLDLKTMLKSAYTKDKRQKHLEKFFRVVFSHAFGVHSKESFDVKTAKEMINTELTQYEFAEALSIRPDSIFIQQMFILADNDKNRYISFREFLDLIVVFAKGSADQKTKLLFDMYDVERTGMLTVDEFKTMIKSMLELVNQTISPDQMDEVISSMFKTVGLDTKQELTFSDFQTLLEGYKEELGYSSLNFEISGAKDITSSGPISRGSGILKVHESLTRAYSYFGDSSEPTRKESLRTSLLRIETKERSREPDWLIFWKRFVDEYKLQIFWLSIYTAMMFYFLINTAHTYSFLKEHGGVRQITGFGLTLSRGSASAMMFCFSTILLTMCRNIITSLRETFLIRFIPFDSAVSFHKYIAFWGLIFSILHSLGHGLNFYHISTQTADDISCLFSDLHHSSHELPKFHNWCWQTITGVTGVLVLCLIILIYVFAIHYSRRHIFNSFWATHNLYPILYILIVLHGIGRVLQLPTFHLYFIIPVTLFTIDRLISVSRKKMEISVIRAVLHPSDVIHLEFKRPLNFEYKSGQWVRIACLALNANEYHPFTIASAPHEETLSLFIRAVGPFTKNLRQTYDPNNLGSRAYPKLYLDGPFGEGHQDWLRFEVSVLVGGGIGVTPFASILKDITFKAGTNSRTVCKKVYFLWVTRTQKHFEWLSDVIRETEDNDKSNLLSTHIFITQFYDKFDLRTTMLYICERHFQRISNRSLFTGLKAKTHFGRPDFTLFLDSLQLEHPEVTRVGVFSCGPGPMTSSVQQACEKLNRREGAIFMHHFENF